MNSLFTSVDSKNFRCSPAILAIFTKQLSVLFNAGVAIHDALDALVDREEGAKTLGSLVVPELRYWVENGHRLSSAFSKFPLVFPVTYVALVKGAEATGKLSYVLQRLGDWLEAQNRIQLQVKKALTYPVFVVFLTGVLTLFLFKSFVPQILDVVTGLGVALPAPTRFLMMLVALCDSLLFWFLVLNLIALAVWYLRSETGFTRFLFFCHSLPVLGPILDASNAARYTSSLGMLLASGLDALKAVALAAESSGNPLHKLDAQRLLHGLRQGQSLAEIYEDSPFYPHLMVYLLKVGDETGRTPQLLEKCAQIMEEDLRHRLDLLVNILEPVVLGVVSLIVGGITVAVMLPMSNLLSALG